ncbi:glycoside hydrolase 43 family protein [Ferruginibacter yonginensis]|uniref:Glycoside hydrolase 43 family protein n=1 Tax=Ferruginibacter yonginensis TaxID=1310416 RepID=A0ABV8QNP1_9BACT
MNKLLVLSLVVLHSLTSSAQKFKSGDETYVNPIIHADYSDPDVIYVNGQFYMVSSSFNQIPGLPILQSNDLVNWRIISHALPVQHPDEVFSKVQHGKGVWAPSIRYHKNVFYIFYPDPDYGIYMMKANNIKGPWSTPKLVKAGKGLIDPCPLWDDDGKVYLVHALAGSRAGFKSIILMHELNASATTILNDAVLVYDGHGIDATIEGPKLYKRNGYYYIFAPAGGVSTGWQLVLRSKNIYGPYERKVVLVQGKTNINGPHQGAWVQTNSGENWFLHFQEKDAYGRIVHLQPMRWLNNWPVIGVDNDGNGIGEPVSTFKKPNVGTISSKNILQTSDEFTGNTIAQQWQWQANPGLNWAYPYPANNSLRMNAVLTSDSNNLWDMPNILSQKFPGENFTATVKFNFQPKTVGERFGLTVVGLQYAAIEVVNTSNGLQLQYLQNDAAEKEPHATVQQLSTLSATNLYFQLQVKEGGNCTFAYSIDNKSFNVLPFSFKAAPGKWIGAIVGMYCSRTKSTNDAGFADVDWFRVVTY